MNTSFTTGFTCSRITSGFSFSSKLSPASASTFSSSSSFSLSSLFSLFSSSSSFFTLRVVFLLLTLLWLYSSSSSSMFLYSPKFLSSSFIATFSLIKSFNIFIKVLRSNKNDVLKKQNLYKVLNILAESVQIFK